MARKPGLRHVRRDRRGAVGRPERAGDEALAAVLVLGRDRGGAHQPRALEVQLVGDLLHAVVGLRDRRRGERVGRDDVGAGAEIGEMDVAHRLRLAQVEQIVVAAHLAVPGIEARAAIAGLVQLVLLDHRAHRAVEHEDALGAPLRAGSSRHSSRGLLHGGPQPEQMADRVDEVGAVHGVEVEIADTPRSTRSSTCSAAIAAAISLRVAGSSSSPSKRAASQSGTEAPVRCAKLFACLKFCTGRMPGVIGHGDAARPHAVEIAEVEIVLEEELRDRARRAGIDLGLQHVDVGIDRGRVRMLLRIGRDRHLGIGDALDAGDQIGAVAHSRPDAARISRRRRRPDRRAAPRCGARRRRDRRG